LLSSRDLFLPDVITNGAAPHLRFGDIDNSREREEAFHNTAALEREDLRNTFGVSLIDPSAIPGELDSIVADLWNEGWDPETRNVGLFAWELGLQLVEAILHLYGGNLIFRQGEYHNHTSIFWPAAKIEAFPFHKSIKCLLNEHGGDTMAYFARGLAGIIRDGAVSAR
jgi:hypothetical protein